MTDEPNTPDPTPQPRGAGPVGEFTRYAKTVAGLDRRAWKNRIGAIVGVVLAVALATIITLDLTGVATIPGMGLMYDVTGVEDPNAARAVERIETKLAESELSNEKREALRAKLMGAQKRVDAEALAPAAPKRATAPTVGVEDTKDLAATEREALADLFADDQKRETQVALVEPAEIQTPNLPDGLTGEAIQKVIVDNAGSMRLCVAESAKKGEMVDGRMDMQITIGANGRVREVNVAPIKMANTVIARCASRRIRGWSFPRFNGEPVTVEYPYVLQTSAF